MKIVHVNFWDKKGGAAIAANRLHKAMINHGIDSKMLVFDKLYDNDNSVTTINTFFNKLIVSFFNIIESRQLVKFRPFIGNFSISSLGLDISKLKIINDADVLYLHWINNNFISISTINKLLKLGKPVVWFLHDMWPMTGGCHHSFECNKYQSKCESCDLLKSTKKKDISFQNFNKKLSLFGTKYNLEIITPSIWLGDCAKKSTLFKNQKISIIPNLIDVSIFKKINKQYAREFLNLPQNKKLILFGADMGENNPYKGWSYLSKALELLDNNYVLVSFGGDLKNSIIAKGSKEVYSIGKLFDDCSLSLLYNACDVFAMPSLAEAFGQTALESISCGTPVVGFDIGGIPDIVDHKVTGYLAKYKNANDLSIGIKWVLENPEYDKLSKTCQSYALTKFSSKHVVEQHLNLLKESLKINCV